MFVRNVVNFFIGYYKFCSYWIKEWNFYKEEYYFDDNKVKNCWSESVVRKGKKCLDFEIDWI